MTAYYDKTRKYQLLDEVGFRKYFKADAWKDFNRQFFDGLAPKYDGLNQVLSFGRHRAIKRRAIGHIGIRPNSRILDVCTGSGDIAVEIARTHPDCEAVGIDASEKMLEIARKRAGNLKNIRFHSGDALDLPFDDGSFDVAMISFGLRNLDDLEKGILELKRVTKKNGCVVNLDLGQPSGAFQRRVYELYFGKFIPFLGRTIFHRKEFNSFHYLPASAEYFPAQAELVEMFFRLGLVNVRRHDFMFGAISQQIGYVE